MTRSDDSRSSGGSATDPLIPAHPDASSRSSLGNAPLAPRAVARPRSVVDVPASDNDVNASAPACAANAATLLSVTPAHFDSANSVRRSTPRVLDGVESAPGPVERDRVDPSRSTDSMELPRNPADAARRTRVRCPRRSTRDERSDETRWT